MTAPVFYLTTEEKEARAWRKVAAHMAERLEHARAMNDGDRPEQETAKLRGRIAELKYLIGLSTKLPAVDEPPR
jgi:hypothetical protein